MEPRIETDSKGSKILYVYYTGDGYDRAIDQAEESFNVVNDPSVTVIAFPDSMARGEAGRYL